MGACRDCTHGTRSKSDYLVRCFHPTAPQKEHPMPPHFEWCKHFRSRPGYYRLQYPALIEPLQGRAEVYRVHIGDHVLDLSLREIDDTFTEVSPTEAEAAAHITEASDDDSA